MNIMGNKQSQCFMLVGQFVDDYCDVILQNLAILLTTFGSLAFSDELVQYATENPEHQALIRKWALILFLLGSFLNFVSFFLNRSRGRRISELENENKELRALKSLIANNVEQIVDGYLTSWATGPLKFVGSERISLYSYDKDGNQFVLVGRFSRSPVYKSKQRATYPADQGCIAVAWNKGMVFENGFPDPSSSNEDYSNHHNKFDVPSDVVQQFTMKSRLYYGYRISDTKYRGLAVVIIEALCPLRFTNNELTKFFGRDERQFISELVAILQPHFTVPSAATRLGM
jgi:hypothetical protein